MKTFGYRFTTEQKNREKESVVSLRKKLEHERSLRHSLSREVSELKETLQTFKKNPNMLPPTHPNRSRH
jgi:hypothetical protein